MDNIYKQLLDQLLCECCKDENVDELKERIMDPMIRYMGRRILPFIVFAFVLIVALVTAVVCVILSTKSRGTHLIYK